MYICDDCRLIFEEPKYEKEYHRELTSPYGTPYEEYAVCPGCGSEFISPAFRCKLCSQYTRNIDVCDTCKDEVKAKYIELVEVLKKEFTECKDPYYEIPNCISDIINET